MKRRIQRRSRALATLLAACGLVSAGCERTAEAPPAEPGAAGPPTTANAALLPPPPVGRAELLQAIDAARSDAAAGTAGADAGLTGRRFAIRQAFGCAGERPGAAAPGTPRWRWGPGRRSIEIGLTPADLKDAPALAGDDTGWEAVEGYWLSRPWLRTEACPRPAPPPLSTEAAAGPTPAAAPAPAVEISGLAAVFAKGGSRVARRDGKAFALTLRGDPLAPPPINGYRLVVEGRFAAFPDGRAIRCAASDLDRPPVCIAAAEVDRVAFEDADGKVLGEWRTG